jgi:integration host factor subunit beta
MRRQKPGLPKQRILRTTHILTPRTPTLVRWRPHFQINDFMNRSELVTALSARFPELGLGDVDTAVKTIVDAIGESLARGERAEIRGFGSFNVAIRPGRASRNPKTGEAVLVPPKAAPRFKPGQLLRERVDKSKLETA